MEAGGSSEIRKTKEEIRETSTTLNELLRTRIRDVESEKNKFKMVEMLVFNGTDPYTWLFRAEHYFQIHKLTEAEKLIVVVIIFEVVALDWYPAKEKQEPFSDWKTLKMRLLQRFQSRQGTVCDQFLPIKQESSVEEYINLFDKLVVPLPHLSDEILENTFMNGLVPWVRAEIECWESVGLI